ncbi:MAG: septum formation inhibitor Maf [Nonlabens sp.]
MKWYPIVLCAIALLTACKESNSNSKSATSQVMVEPERRNLSQEFKDYWYEATAEINSYTLSQSRYGELREGNAVLVFVTEPFDAQDQIKADQPGEDQIPVLKLNATKDFITGIYPYHIMSSTYLPLDTKSNAIKIASSIQEWCGQSYMQMNSNGKNYDVQLRSYFQSEGNVDFQVHNVMTENQLAIQLRIDPRKMPLDSINIIPSMEYLRLKHKETRSYKAFAKLNEIPDGLLYSVKFPELGRTIAYKVEKQFPYKILSWMDRYNDGGTPMVSTAQLKQSIKTAYWNQNKTVHEALRDTLQL